MKKALLGIVHIFRLALIFGAACPVISASAAVPVVTQQPVPRQERIIIQLKRGADIKALEAFHAAQGHRVFRRHPNLGNLQTILVPPGKTSAQVVEAYRQSGLVEFAEADGRIHANDFPDDPSFVSGKQWDFHNTVTPGADINALGAWTNNISASNVIVAIVDTGIRYTHEDLADNIWVNPGETANGLDDDHNGIIDDIHGINAIDDTGNVLDDAGHGTHVAGVIGAIGNNGRGIAGIAWKVQLMACKFLDSTGEGATSDAIQCIDYARSKGASIINASWASGQSSTALRTAISNARSAGIIFVAAAGNESANNDVVGDYPTDFDLDNIVSVAATTSTDALASYSNYGLTTVDIGAPGDNIYSAYNFADDSYATLSGTSMATPHVTGALALMKARFPNDSYLQLIARLYASVDKIPSLAGKCTTGGRLNLGRALDPNLLSSSFTKSAQVVVPGTDVGFTDTSFGSIVSRVLDFGDGSSITNSLPAHHTFIYEGNYAVVLTLIGSNSIAQSTQTISVVRNYSLQSTPFLWTDPTAMLPLTLTDNGVSPAQVLPFPVNFYSHTYNQIYVGANGIAGFTNTLTSATPTDLPSKSAPPALISAFWDDLNPASAGKVYFGITGSAPARQAVISWVGVPNKSKSLPHFSFQIVITEQTGDIQFNYLDVQPTNASGSASGKRATVGLQNDSGELAVAYSLRGGTLLSNQQSMLFLRPRPDLSVSDAIPAPAIAGAYTNANFTLQNNGSADCHWLAIPNLFVVKVSPANGVLRPGDSMTVSATVDASASVFTNAVKGTINFVNVTDGTGNTSRELFLVSPSVPSIPAAEKITISSTNPNPGQPASFQLSFQLDPNQPYSVETSTNLVDWVTLATGLANPDGSVHWGGSASSQEASRFFRVVK